MTRVFLFTVFVLFANTACSQVESPVPLEDGTPTPQTITSFEECVAAGNAILRSLPAKCISADGIVFVEKLDKQKDTGESESTDEDGVKGKSLCKDQCGNGTCEQIVCFGEGCPCPETPMNCKEDCAISDESHWK